MKIKGYRFPCEVCGENKIVSSVQVFYRKDGQVGYARARHLGADKKFYYHQQSLEYTNKKLRELFAIGQNQVFDNTSLAHMIGKSSQQVKLEPSAGFGPATITLPR
jgi:hypothetical protein